MGDQIRGRHDPIDQTDTISLLRADHLSGENEFERPSLPYQPRQALRAATTGKEPELDFGLAEFCVLDRDPDCAGHRRFATSAKCKAVYCRDHGLAEILDEVQHLLAEAARLFRLERRHLG